MTRTIDEPDLGVTCQRSGSLDVRARNDAPILCGWKDREDV